MNFMKWIPVYFVFSALVIGAGVFSMIRWGFSYSIGFTGGSLMEIRYTNASPSSEEVTAAVKDLYVIDSVIASPSNKSFIIKGASIEDSVFIQVKSALEKLGTYELIRYESVGPVISGELIRKTFAAVILVSVIILTYLGWQFHELRYGVSAVLAMFHDSLVLLGIFSLLGHFADIELDVLFVTAMLTALSFSVHDTIVVFHRIRELKDRYPRALLEDILNAAVMETMSRSINNSVTIVLMLLALTLLGGESLFGFSLALLLGAITGTYSSPFIAVPLLLLWNKIELRIKARRGVAKKLHSI